MSPNRRDRFSNSIPSFNESLDVELTLLWINKINRLFDLEYIPIEDQVEFVTYKLKGRAATWWNQFQNPYVRRQITYKNVETDEKTFTSP